MIYPARHCNVCLPLFPVSQKALVTLSLQHLVIVLLSKLVTVLNLCVLILEPIQLISQESALGKVASPSPLKQVFLKRSSFFRVVMAKLVQLVDTWISQIQLASLRPSKPLIFKSPSFQDLTDGLVEIYIYISLTCLAHVWSRNSLYLFFHSSPALVFFLDPMQTPNPPPYDSEKSSNGQKITMNPDGYSNKASSLRIFGGGRGQEDGGRTTLAGHRIVWPNGVTACGPGPNPGVNLRSTAISSFRTTTQKAFMGRLNHSNYSCSY